VANLYPFILSAAQRSRRIFPSPFDFGDKTAYAEEATNHSTKLSKYDSQVAGYQG
jgi:hypothetical protein